MRNLRMVSLIANAGNLTGSNRHMVRRYTT